jgi:hypothetical protein
MRLNVPQRILVIQTGSAIVLCPRSRRFQGPSKQQDVPVPEQPSDLEVVCGFRPDGVNNAGNRDGYSILGQGEVNGSGIPLAENARESSEVRNTPRQLYVTRSVILVIFGRDRNFKRFTPP